MSTVDRLFTAAGRADPYLSYRRLREIAPVHYDARLDTYLVLGYDDCAAALSDPGGRTPDPAWLDERTPGWRDHSAAMWLYHSLLRRNPPAHGRIRRVMSRFPRHRPALDVAVDRVLDGLDSVGATVDLQETVARPLPTMVIGSLVGVPESDLRWLRTAVDDLAVVLDPLLPAAARERADRAADELGAYFTDLLARRSAEPRDDMASRLAAASADGTLLPGEARDALLLLFAAGFETTSGLIGNAVNAVLRHPEHRSAEPAALIAETLRWDSPVQLTERVSGNAGVTLVLGAANRDPARFPDPDRFDPARFAAGRFDPRRGDRQALSFGAGPHYCLGAPLARSLATRVLDGFLRRFPGATLAGEPVRRSGLALRGFASLPVALGIPGFPRSDAGRTGGTVGEPDPSTKDEP